MIVTESMTCRSIILSTGARYLGRFASYIYRYIYIYITGTYLQGGRVTPVFGLHLSERAKC